MKDKSFKLGLFILGALVIFILAVFLIGDTRMFSSGYPIKVLFSFGDGLKPASPIRIAGVDAGEIREVTVIKDDGKTMVLVNAWIKKGMNIPEGSEVFVNNLGLLGEKYLEILPNAASDKFIQPGGLIRGRDSIPLYKTGELVRTSLVQVHTLLNSINEMLDLQTTLSLKRFVKHLEATSSELEGILTQIRSEKGTLGKFLYTDTIYEDLEGLIKDLRKHPWKLLHKAPESKKKSSK